MMGRAFPELQMCTPTLYGVTATPMAIADEKGNSRDHQHRSTTAGPRRLARTLTIDMGCSAMIAIYPMTGKQVKETVRPQHDLAHRADRPHDPRGATRAHVDPIEAVRAATRRLSSSGAARSATSRGGPRPASPAARRPSPASTSTTAGSLRIAFQNEFLIAQTDDEVLVDDPRPDHHPRRRNRRADHDRIAALRLPRRRPGDAVRSALAHPGRSGGRRSRLLRLRRPLRPDRRSLRRGQDHLTPNRLPFGR